MAPESERAVADSFAVCDPSDATTQRRTATRTRIPKEIRLKQRQAAMKKKSPFADERFKLNKARHLRILNAIKRGQTVYVTFDRTVYTPNFHHNAQRGRMISAERDCFLVRVLLEKHKHPHRFYTGFLIPTTREPR